MQPLFFPQPAPNLDFRVPKQHFAAPKIAPDPNLAVAPLLVVSDYCFTLLLCVHFMFEIALFTATCYRLCDVLIILHLYIKYSAWIGCSDTVKLL
uniref:Uncharacterized protein n=1 Tax=Rhipicephalus zambeziensis TaxID=60191 RepID=A0A224Y9H7_9ACAR